MNKVRQWSMLTAAAVVVIMAAGWFLLVSKQNMTGMIARLEQLGLAERSGDPNDLRSARVQLTRKGRTLLDKTRPAYEEWIAKLAGGVVTERDLQALTRTVNKLITAIEETQT